MFWRTALQYVSHSCPCQRHADLLVGVGISFTIAALRLPGDVLPVSAGHLLHVIADHADPRTLRAHDRSPRLVAHLTHSPPTMPIRSEQNLRYRASCRLYCIYRVCRQ